MSSVTIVMYHYVRELTRTRYPKIKGLHVREFSNQLDYLESEYNFVTVEQCMDAVYGPTKNFPENAMLLTFDDGYKEHYTEVFPILNARGIQGAFFPPVQAITEHKVLDVNKIHFVLASVDQPERLVQSVNKLIGNLAREHDLKDPEYYSEKLSDSKHRYDPPEVVYVKRLLQRELPEVPRKIILNHLFEEHVGIEEEVFARELYMSADQIKCMARNGMFIGGHGYSHKWMNAMEAKEQEFEIEKTKDFLASLGVSTDNWVMCYPYGAYDHNLIEILKDNNCALGLATEVGVAELSKNNAFHLPRLDTNDFPK